MEKWRGQRNHARCRCRGILLLLLHILTDSAVLLFLLSTFLLFFLLHMCWQADQGVVTLGVLMCLPKFRRVTIRGHNPPRGSQRRFASQRGFLRGFWPSAGVSSTVLRGSAGFRRLLWESTGFSEGSDPILVTLRNCWSVCVCGQKLHSCLCQGFMHILGCDWPVHALKRCLSFVCCKRQPDLSPDCQTVWRSELLILVASSQLHPKGFGTNGVIQNFFLNIIFTDSTCIL